MLLVLLLSVYVNLVKELFLLALFHVVFTTVFPKASAKVLLFFELTKFFTKYFRKNLLFLGLNDQNQGKSAIHGQYERIVAETTVLEGCGGFTINRGEPNSTRRQERD